MELPGTAAAAAAAAAVVAGSESLYAQANVDNRTEMFRVFLNMFRSEVQETFRTASDHTSLFLITEKAQNLKAVLATKRLNPDQSTLVSNAVEEFNLQLNRWESKLQSATQERLKGDDFMKKKAYTKALIHYNKALEYNSRDIQVYCNRAYVFMILGKKTDAMSDAEKCIELDPQYKGGYLYKGMIFLRDFDYEKAQSTFQEGLTFNPGDKQLADFLQWCVSQKNLAAMTVQENLPETDSDGRRTEAHSNVFPNVFPIVGSGPPKTGIFTLKVTNAILTLEVAAIITDHLGLRLPSLICSFLAVCGLVWRLNQGPLNRNKLTIAKFICAAIMLLYCLVAYVAHVTHRRARGVERFGKESWPFHLSIILASILFND